MDVTANDVREVRFGTTRMRAGYNMAEVDAFLDKVEKAIASYTEGYQRAKDDADALRSQVQQVQGRIEALQAELREAQDAHASAEAVRAERDTIVVEIPDSREAADAESTAENPVIAVPDGAPADSAALDELRGIRDRVRSMLEQQLELVDSVSLPTADSDH